jgi:Arc/MetJ-type ribon-helix-helix transcriptional regulator
MSEAVKEARRLLEKRLKEIEAEQRRVKAALRGLGRKKRAS